MKLILGCLLFTMTAHVCAQEISTIGDTITYFKDGLVFEHEPHHFKAHFRFRVQNRFTYVSTDSQDLSPELINFEVRRARLRLEGHVLDPRLLYKFQFSFTRGDFDYDRTEYPNVLRDAVVGWKLSDSTVLWYGQTKLPGNRERVISSGAQQFVDRSLLNAVFNLDRDIGAQMYHRIGIEKPFWIKLAISNGEGRSTNNQDDGLAYTSRIEWLPLGNFKDNGDYFEADLSRETSPKLALGAVYSANKKTTRPGGQLGRQYETEGLNSDLETYFADLIFKYQGFSWMTEYANRWTNDAIVMDGANQVVVYKGQGVNTQIGYLLENNFEPALRFTKIWADRETLEGVNDQNQYTAALSKYIDGHKIKVQTDLTYAEEMNHVKDLYEGQWIYRLQLEIGI